MIVKGTRRSSTSSSSPFPGSRSRCRAAPATPATATANPPPLEDRSLAPRPRRDVRRGSLPAANRLRTPRHGDLTQPRPRRPSPHRKEQHHRRSGAQRPRRQPTPRPPRAHMIMKWTPRDYAEALGANGLLRLALMPNQIPPLPRTMFPEMVAIGASRSDPSGLVTGIPSRSMSHQRTAGASPIRMPVPSMKSIRSGRLRRWAASCARLCSGSSDTGPCSQGHNWRRSSWSRARGGGACPSMLGVVGAFPPTGFHFGQPESCRIGEW